MGQTATNPQTGEKVQWDGKAWVPVTAASKAITATNPQTGEKLKFESGRWQRLSPQDLSQIPALPPNDVSGKLAYPFSAAAAGIAGLPNIIARSSPGGNEPPALQANPQYQAATKAQSEALARHTYSPEEIMAAAQKHGLATRAETTGGQIAQDVGTGVVSAIPAALTGDPLASALALTTGGIAGGTTSALQAAGASPTVQTVAAMIIPLVGMKAGGLLLQRTPPNLLAAALQAGKTRPNFAQELTQTVKLMDGGATFGEGLNKITNGAFPQLLAYQRVAEKAPGGQDVLGPFMAERLKQNTQAINQQIGQLPIGQAEGQVPTQVQQAAKDVMQRSMLARKEAVDPFYEAARGVLPADVIGETGKHVITKAQDITGSIEAATPALDEWADLLKRPTMRSAWSRAQNLAADEGYGIHKWIEIDPQANVTRVLKTPDARTGDYMKRALDGIVAEEKAKAAAAGDLNTDYGRIVEGLRTKWIDLMSRNNEAYAQGRYAHQQLSEHAIRPLRGGPIGQLAEAMPPTLGNIRNTLGLKAGTETDAALSPQEVALTVRRLGKEDPAAVKDALGQIMSEDLQNTVATKRPGYGAQQAVSTWRYRLFGSNGSINEQRWKAAVENSGPDGKTKWQGMQGLLDSLDAQGYRLPPGSNTAADTKAISQLQQSALPNPLSPGELNPLASRGWLAQKWDDYFFGKNTAAMADLLANKKNAPYWAALAKVDPKSQSARTLVAAILGTTAVSPLRLGSPASP